jgi:hypothetical protein
MVLAEQVGEPYLAKGLERAHFGLIEKLAEPPPEIVHDEKARLATELYELRKRGKPVTPVTEEEWLEYIDQHPEYIGFLEEGEEWKVAAE